MFYIYSVVELNYCQTSSFLTIPRSTSSTSSIKSIIKIISSPTLQNNLFGTNTFKFMEIIKNSDKVIVMDAFLQY